MLPTTADGTPLCLLDDLRGEPHAWVKLWKHHAAQPEADRINAVAAERGEPWLRATAAGSRRSGSSRRRSRSSTRRPRSTTRADRLIEAADWVVWQLTGVETRNNCTAGYKAMWSKRDGFPADDYFAALDPRLEHVVDEKLSRAITPIGTRAGVLTERSAVLTGLRPGTAVAVANVDAHVSAPAATVTAARDDGRDHGHEQLPHRARRRARARRGDVRRRRGRRRPRSLRLRGRPVGGRGHLRLVRGPRRPARVPRAKHAGVARMSTPSSSRRPRRCGRARAGSSRSTGGTATAPSSSTPSSAACSSG